MMITAWDCQCGIKNIPRVEKFRFSRFALWNNVPFQGEDVSGEPVEGSGRGRGYSRADQAQGRDNILLPFEKNYRFLFPFLLLLFDDVIVW